MILPVFLQSYINEMHDTPPNHSLCNQITKDLYYLF